MSSLRCKAGQMSGFSNGPPILIRSMSHLTGNRQSADYQMSPTHNLPGQHLQSLYKIKLHRSTSANPFPLDWTTPWNTTALISNTWWHLRQAQRRLSTPWLSSSRRITKTHRGVHRHNRLPLNTCSPLSSSATDGFYFCCVQHRCTHRCTHCHPRNERITRHTSWIHFNGQRFHGRHEKDAFSWTDIRFLDFIENVQGI